MSQHRQHSEYRAAPPPDHARLRPAQGIARGKMTLRTFDIDVRVRRAFQIGHLFEGDDPVALGPVDQNIARDREQIALRAIGQAATRAVQGGLVYVLSQIGHIFLGPPVLAQIARQRGFEGKNLLTEPYLKLGVVHHCPADAVSFAVTNATTIERGKSVTSFCTRLENFTAVTFF